jgi:maleylacetate reductase
VIVRFDCNFLASRVLFGPGRLGEVGAEARRLGKQRALFVCTPSLCSSTHAARVRASLGELLVLEYTNVEPHVPVHVVEKGIALANRYKIDLVIALGGGSAIGVGKAITFYASTSSEYTAINQQCIPLIAIPTTYAGSEATPVLGITDLELGQKQILSDPRIIPRVVIYDPEVTFDLPSQLTASTGVNALAHCVEAVYSRSSNPLIRAVALDGIARIRWALPRCVETGQDLKARSIMLIGAFMAGFSLANAGMALHHGICHSLGGKFRLQHGIINAIMLPHVMRYNADTATSALAEIASALGIPASDTDMYKRALQAADLVYEFVGSLGLPQRLRDINIAESDLLAVAEGVMHSRAVLDNPKPITSAKQVLAILRQAW